MARDGNTLLDIYQFGTKLVETNDLDPIYVMLWEAELPRDILEKWLLAYWCFYHSGTSSWITDGKSYWDRFKQAASSKAFPRSHERRHFRGQKAVDAASELAQIGVDKIFSVLSDTFPQRVPLVQVMNYFRELPQFGPWISFKAADMLERLDLLKVQFDDGDMFLFESPRKGAEMLWDEHNPGIAHETEPGGVRRWAVDMILNDPNLAAYLAPPRYERRINCQEAETILCKWKSYMGGHYTLGEDILSLRRHLLMFSRRSKIAQRLYKVGRRTKLWK